VNLLNKSEPNPYKNVKCHLCNQMGHIRPQCPDNPNNYKTGKSKEKYNVPEIKFAMACEEKPPNSIVDNNCKIFGAPAEAVFDTGCNAVVIRKDLIPKHYKLGKKTKVYNFMGVPVYLLSEVLHSMYRCINWNDLRAKGKCKERHQFNRNRW